MEEVRSDWKAIIVAIVTDASGESRKARQVYGRAHPSVIVLDCYAHQVRLIHFSITHSILI